MPRACQHFVIAGLAGATVDCLIQWEAMSANPEATFDVGELLLCAVGAGFAGWVPDLLEPATNPNHRGVCHSVAAGFAVAWALSGRHTERLPWALRLLMLMGVVGYGSHLLADAMTPKCIRLL